MRGFGEHTRAGRLVLQIGRDDAARINPAGAICVMLREEDIRERRFERAWTVYDCERSGVSAPW
jgi:hypothetical protein